jgi:hypothetical protein
MADARSMPETGWQRLNFPDGHLERDERAGQGARCLNLVAAPCQIPQVSWQCLTISGTGHEQRNPRLNRTSDLATCTLLSPPAVRIEPDDYTPTITCDATLAQHIAMAVDCDPWTVFTALDDAAGLNDKDDPPADNEGATVVNMTEGYRVPEWPYKRQRS